MEIMLRHNSRTFFQMFELGNISENRDQKSQKTSFFGIFGTLWLKLSKILPKLKICKKRS